MSRAEVMQKVKEAQDKVEMEIIDSILREMGIVPESEKPIFAHKDIVMDRSQRARKPVENYVIGFMWFQGLSYGEIAAAVSMSKEGVKGRLKEMKLYEKER